MTGREGTHRGKGGMRVLTGERGNDGEGGYSQGKGGNEGEGGYSQGKGGNEGTHRGKGE